MGVQFEETLHLPAQAHAQRAAGFARGARCAFFLEPDLFDGVEPGLADCLIRRVRIEQAVEHRRKRHVGFNAVLHQQRQELAHRFALARGHLLDRINTVTHPELCAQLGIGIRHGVFTFLPIGPPFGAAREQIHQALLGVVEAELAHQMLECLRVRALGIGPQMRGELLPGFFAQRTGVLGECGMRPAIGVAGRCQRREFDQAEEPAVKGVNRNARLCVEQFIEQAACGIHQGARLGVAQAALDQELHYLGIVLHQGKFAAPAHQTLPHFAGRFAGESKGEDRTRLGPRQQQPQHA